MEILRAGFDPENFFRALARAPRRLLLLDYDGTLAPFRARRDRAFPYPGVRELLAAIHQEGGSRLVSISGRTVKEVKSLLGIEPAPEIWGSHGHERYSPDGGYRVFEVGPAAGRGLRRAKEFLNGLGFASWCEEKAGSVALHFRGQEPAQVREVRQKTEERWRTLASDCGLQLHEFDGGIELRVPDVNKGDAVSALLAEMTPAPAAAYLGDDLTDEDAFEALRGRGLRVLVRPEFRPTRADWWIRPPDELLDFLSKWRNASREKQ